MRRRYDAPAQLRVEIEEAGIHVVVRKYSNAVKLIDELERRQPDVEEITRGAPGFRAYYLVRTADGGTSVTICNDQAGTDESTRRAAEWIRANLPDLGIAPPEVTEGEAIIEFRA